MSNFDEYFTGGCSISLENVVYKKLDEIEGEVTLNVKDALEIKEKHLDNIEIIISRNLSFSPYSLVDITVTFGVILELKDKYVGDGQLDYELIKNELIDDDCVIISIIMSRISLLISQLTSSYGERPIITPPSFMEAE